MAGDRLGHPLLWRPSRSRRASHLAAFMLSELSHNPCRILNLTASRARPSVAQTGEGVLLAVLPWYERGRWACDECRWCSFSARGFSPALTPLPPWPRRPHRGPPSRRRLPECSGSSMGTPSSSLATAAPSPCGSSGSTHRRRSTPGSPSSALAARRRPFSKHSFTAKQCASSTSPAPHTWTSMAGRSPTFISNRTARV